MLSGPDKSDLLADLRAEGLQKLYISEQVPDPQSSLSWETKIY